MLNSFRAFKFENVIPLFGEKEYTLKKEKYEKSIWKCKICSEKFEDWYANGIEPRCPICNPYLGRFSILEKQIVDYIKFLNIENIIENSKKIIPPLELDIFLPEKKLAIEFNGTYWHSTECGKDR